MSETTGAEWKVQRVAFYNRRARGLSALLDKNRYYHQELQKLARFLIPDDAKVVEIGCGAADLLVAIPARQKTGVDVSPDTLAQARAFHPQIEFVESAAEDLNLRDTFDYALFSEIIGELDDVETALKRVRQSLHPRGRVVIFAYNCLWGPLLRMSQSLGVKTKPFQQTWFDRGDVENFLDLAGFEIVRSGESVLCPFYIPLISAFCNRILARVPLFRRLALIQYVVARPKPARGREVSVSVIVPARNEKGNIELIVQRTPEFPAGSEIIFVEGHSKDGTWEEIQRVAEKYRGRRNIEIARQDGIGKNDAVKKGFDMARNDLLMILDADMTVPPEDLAKFYDAFVEGRGDLINGSRLVYPMEEEAMRPLNFLGNAFFAKAFSWLLSQRIKDTLCGTKVLLKSDYERIKRNRAYFGDFDPFGDFDLLFGAAKLNLKIIDLPVRYRSRTYGTTQISRFRHGWLCLGMCWFALRKLKFAP